MRRRDLAAAARVDGYVAISTAVAQRIERAYGRSAAVVHPPVEVNEFAPAAVKDRDHFAWVHRLTPYKRPQEVIEAFRGLPQRLTMVGVGPLAEQLRPTLPPNVELRAWISRKELASLLAGAGGFIHVGEEDFGISMAEALAAGTPVLALSRGGSRDIVEDGVSGVMVDDADPESIRAGVTQIAQRDWDSAALAAAAQRFSRERFVADLTAHLAELARSR